MTKMKMKQSVTKAIEIDAGHRLLDEPSKCRHIHGHRFRIELTFSFKACASVGYAINFGDIKKIAGDWLNEHMDHGFIANPEDTVMIEACRASDSKLYLMSLNGIGEYCNPTAENIAVEIFIVMSRLFQEYDGLKLVQVRCRETPNSWADCFA